MKYTMIKELYSRAVSLEEFSRHIKREERIPEISFDEFCKDRGDPDISHSYLTAICDAIFYGKDHINMNEGSLGLTAGPKRRKKGEVFIDKYKRLNEEYRRLVSSGDIKTLTIEQDLNLDYGADEAYCRNLYRVTCRNSLLNGIPILKENLELAGLENKCVRPVTCRGCAGNMDWQHGQGVFIRDAWVCSNCGDFESVDTLIQSLISLQPKRVITQKEKCRKEGRGFPLSYPAASQQVLL